MCPGALWLLGSRKGAGCLLAGMHLHLCLSPHRPASCSAPCKPSEGDSSKRHVHSMFSLSSQSTLISGVERDSPLGILGCHLWHLLSLQKNKFKCSAPGF